MTAVHRLLDRVVCRYSTHDWWALAYPPARRWECRRCGLIAEEAPSSLPERRRVRRDRSDHVRGDKGQQDRCQPPVQANSHVGAEAFEHGPSGRQHYQVSENTERHDP